MSEERKDNLTFLVKGDLIGLPGQPFRVVIRRVTAAEASGDKKRTFSVTFILSRPGEAIVGDRRLPSASLLQGNSYLRLLDSALSAQQQPEIRFHVLIDKDLYEIKETVNSDGFIGKLEITSIKASSFFEAETIARKVLIPSISWHSTHLDTPLNIFQVDTKELQSEDFMVYRTSKPYEALVIPQGIRIFDIKEESAAYASIYREALNSNSHIYQFLCFYKIIEGLTTRRIRLKTAAVARGEKPVSSPEKLPRDVMGLIELLGRLFSFDFKWDEIHAAEVFPRQFWGKKITSIVATTLHPLRNKVAHAFLDPGEVPLSIDEMVNYLEIANILPMTKCLARWMLKNEFPSQFPSDK